MSVIASLAGDVIYQAYRHARLLKRPQAGVSTSEGLDGLTFLNQIVDQWAARKCYAWATPFTEYTLTPNHQPHLLGPGLLSPDFATAPAGSPRPPRIESAALILNNVTPNVDVPLNVRDAGWWANQRVKALATNVPTDVYYQPDFLGASPAGALWLWPVPTFAYGMRLQTWEQLLQFATVGTSFVAPPSYLAAAALTLAEVLGDMCPDPLCRPPPGLPARAARARAILGMNNNSSPRIASADIGMHPSGGARRGDFNYYSGQ